MDDTTFGYLILGVGIVFVLALVFVAARRAAAPRPTPPPGVHMPGPSWLPIRFAVAAGLMGAGLAFRPHDPPGQVANWFLLIPGLVVFVLSAVAWVRAAGREWHETEHGSHDDSAGH